MSRLVEQGIAVFVAVLGVAYAAFPGLVGGALSPVTAALIEALVWAHATLPWPVFLLAFFSVIAVVAVLAAVVLGRLLYALLQSAGPRTQRLYRRVTPGTPIGKMAVGMGLLTLFLLGSVWALPYAIGELGDDSAVSAAGDFGQRSANGDVDPLALSTDDTLAYGGDARADADGYDRPTPDADGDRLKDEWEERGETPAGVELPGADPDRMDLYVQVNYGGGVYPLTDAEKRQLRAAWADMPVENPDGSQGIALHLDDSPPHGGPLGTAVAPTGTGYAEVHRFYTAERVGDRRCRYHQVVVGDADGDRLRGVSHAPGFAAVVGDEPREYEGDRSPRVHLVTHHLLHNVVGSVGEGGHADGGWLSTTVGPGESYLDRATADRVSERGFAGSAGYQRDRC